MVKLFVDLIMVKLFVDLIMVNLFVDLIMVNLYKINFFKFTIQIYYLILFINILNFLQ
jgi:hypothetical protein